MHSLDNNTCYNIIIALSLLHCTCTSPFACLAQGPQAYCSINYYYYYIHNYYISRKMIFKSNYRILHNYVYAPACISPCYNNYAIYPTLVNWKRYLTLMMHIQTGHGNGCASNPKIRYRCRPQLITLSNVKFNFILSVLCPRTKYYCLQC